LANGLENAVGGFAYGVDNAVLGATFRLSHLNQSNLSIGQSLTDLVGEIPLVGHFLTGGNTPDVTPTGHIYTAISQGINAPSLQRDIERNKPLQDAVASYVSNNQTVLNQITYPNGSLFDVGFSLLGLSNGYAYSAAQQILDQGVSAGDTVNFVAHSGGVQRLAEASRILADYDIYGNALVGIAGPVIGSFNNLNNIGLVGSTGPFVSFTGATTEPTSDLQYALQNFVSAGGSSQNVTYQPVPGPTIPHGPPDPLFAPDKPYFDFLKSFLATYGNQTGH